MAAWGQRSSIMDWMPKAVAGNAAPAAPKVTGAGAALGQPNPFNNDPARNVGRDGGGLPVVGNANPFGWTYGGPAAPPGTRGNQAPPAAAPPPPAPGTPPPAATGHDAYTANNPYAGGPGAGVTVDAQGNVHLPNGLSLGQANSFTLNVNGQQVRVAGNYNGSNEALWQVNGVGETAMDRFSRRMNDLARAGVNVNDPNVQYRELARVRDDAIYALTQRLGRPPTDQELQAATGFAHINNFVRGANGEPGYQAPPPATGNQAPPPAAGSQAPPPATGNQAPPPANGAQGGNQAPPASGMQAYTNPVTGQQGSAALADIALMGNDADAVATRRALLMRGLGLDPTAQGLFYSSINKTLGDAMDRYLALQGIAPGTQYGTIQQNMRNFEGLVNSGDYYGGLTASADAARQALLNGGMNGLDAGTQFSVLNQVLGQQAEGLNPILAQAMANRASNARTTFGQQSIDRLNAGQGELTDPVAWLRNSPWADLLG